MRRNRDSTSCRRRAVRWWRSAGPTASCAEAAARAVLAGTWAITPKASDDWVEQLRCFALHGFRPSERAPRPSTRCMRWWLARLRICATSCRGTSCSPRLPTFASDTSMKGALSCAGRCASWPNGTRRSLLRSSPSTASWRRWFALTPAHCSSSAALDPRSPAHSWSLLGTTLSACAPRPPSPRCAACRRCLHRPARPSATRAYVARRTSEGLSKREILRRLKRYIARQVFQVPPRPALT